MAEKKYMELTLQQKCNLLKFLETNSERKAAKEFGVSKTTVNNIKKRKSEYLDRLQNESASMKRKKPNNELNAVNKLTREWLVKMRGLNAKINGPMLKEVALKFARELNLNDFKASSGWLERFKIRNNISFKTPSVDANEIDPLIVTDFRNQIPNFFGDYEPENIFNVDECGLFFKALPNRFLDGRDDSCKSRKIAREKITVLFAVSARGEKLDPLIIGKYEDSRCFKNIKRPLPVIWKTNKKACMTSKLFADWLNRTNNLMRKQNRRILIVVDDSPWHQHVEDLSHVTLKFLPNAFSILQPLDLGVIRRFKFHYRKLFLNEVVTKSEELSSNTLDIAANVGVSDSILWISQAWDAVKKDTVEKCFQHAGWIAAESNGSESENVDMGNFEDLDINSYLECDLEVSTSERINPEQVFNDVWEDFVPDDRSQKSSEKDDEDEVIVKDVKPTLSGIDVLRMLNDIESRFAVQKCPEIVPIIYEAKAILNDFLCKEKKCKQVKLVVS